MYKCIALCSVLFLTVSCEISNRPSTFDDCINLEPKHMDPFNTSVCNAFFWEEWFKEHEPKQDKS